MFELLVHDYVYVGIKLRYLLSLILQGTLNICQLLLVLVWGLADVARHYDVVHLIGFRKQIEFIKEPVVEDKWEVVPQGDKMSLFIVLGECFAHDCD